MQLGARRKPRLGRRLAFMCLLVLVVTLLLAWFRVGPAPAISIEPALAAIGPRTPIRVEVTEGRRGLSTVSVELLQEGQVIFLEKRSFDPRPFWSFWGERTRQDTFDFVVGRDSLPNLGEGEATLRVVAGRANTWLRHPDPEVQELTIPVSLRPPKLEMLSDAPYVSQGGSGLVVYRVGESSVRDGVLAGDWWFPGFPLPGGAPDQRFSLFSAPYDLEEKDAVRLRAEDELGNFIETPFLRALKVKPLQRDTIRLSSSFLERVVPLIQAESPQVQRTDDLLADYLAINGELRQANGDELKSLAAASLQSFLWSGPFEQLPGSKVMSRFADRRTYTFEGREVDHQDHLGFDLASTRRARVPASNGGKVVLARFLGIYGRTVIVDHGYGLMTLYAHLSSLSVEEGQQVETGEVLGRTGQSGLAGGDHLHFTLMIQGLAVNPVEWWGRGWIIDSLLSKLEIDAD